MISFEMGSVSRVKKCQLLRERVGILWLFSVCQGKVDFVVPKGYIKMTFFWILLLGRKKLEKNGDISSYDDQLAKITLNVCL